MSSQRRSRSMSQVSKLLNDDENQLLMKLLGPRSVSMASAVVQVVCAEPPYHNRWSVRCTGVACFVKDNSMRTYYIRVFDLRSTGNVFEQEIYNQMRYNKKKPFFHCFEGDECPVGLNFANEDEANIFYGAVNDKLGQRKQRREERKRQTLAQNKNQTRSPNVAPPPPSAAPAMTGGNTRPSSSSGNDTLKKKDKDKKDKKPKKGSKLTKDQIGTPTDFRHVGHVGWDPDKGFDMDNLDPNLKTLFDTVGLSESQLNDKETATFIYEFIEQHGGMEAIKREQGTTPQPPQHQMGHMSGAPPPPPPSSRAPPPPARTGAPPPPPPARPPAVAPPPPPPARSGGGRGMGGAPPPPPMRANPMPAHHAPPVAPPPPPPPGPAFGGGGGAPPPPPPPPAPGPPPPPVPSDMGASPASSGRNALLDSIHKGTNLKHVEDQQATPAGGRNALLDAIRGSHQLKKVDPSELENRELDQSQAFGGGIAGALAKALADRKKVIQDDDESEDDEDTEDEDEWD